MKIKVSHDTFNEIEAALQSAGREIDGNNDITIEKTDALVQPINFKLATVRRDCLCEAVKVATSGYSAEVMNITDLANEMYEFVIKGKQTTKPEKDGWK